MALQRLEMTPIFIPNVPSNVTWIWHHQRQHAIFFIIILCVATTSFKPLTMTVAPKISFVTILNAANKKQCILYKIILCS